ncbi:MAG: S8 family serine peptidase [Cyclobacteriaceae bacterium]|nr:S8 family serine peptidase [Cyclobacteriaceae bacterium SS2]
MSRLKLAFLLFIFSSAQAQQKYWVYQPDSLDITHLLPGPKAIFCSDWIKACSYFLTDKQASQIKEAGIPVSPVNQFYYQHTSSPSGFGFALDQIDGQSLVNEGLNGQGVKIGVIDGGFSGVEKDPTLQHFKKEDRLMAFRDYIKKDNPSVLAAQSGDTHGSEVLQLIGGYHPERDILFGLATHAKYYLARTDFEGFEKRIEEDNLIAAMEWMHEEGVEIINISLGYTKGFNNKSENYRPEQMDGQTSAVAKAVEHAATEKGMLIVVAAGNEANILGWNVLSTPGDAEHALTVGSSQLLVWDKARFSSIGPTFLSYTKPDVVVFSGTGTSYSAPIITGLAACIKQFDRELSNLEIIEIIRKSGHLYPYPNNYLGFGVPQCENILKILRDRSNEIERPEIVRTSKNKIKIPLTLKENRIVLYHKNEYHHVVRRAMLRPAKSSVIIKRAQSAQQTTVLFDHSAKEIIWEGP